MQDLYVDPGHMNPDGHRWVRLDDVHGDITLLMRHHTVMGAEFLQELRRRDAGNPANEYYALMDKWDQVHVAVRIGHDPETARSAEDGMERNCAIADRSIDPFNRYGWWMQSLSERLRREIGPEDYPYRKPLNNPELNRPGL